MQVTVGALKKIINDLPDDIVLAHLEYGNDSFDTFSNVKRVLLVQADENWGNKKFLVVNGQGSHFTGKGEQAGMKILNHWDHRNLDQLLYKPD